MEILFKNGNFGQKRNFFSKMEILSKTGNFDQNWKICSKMENFFQNWKLEIKCLFSENDFLFIFI